MTNGKYTQQELLLLSNFVYIPVCASDEPIRDIIEPYRDPSGTFTAESVAKAAAGGGMSADDVAAVFRGIDKRIGENPGFGMLSASRRLEEGNVRGICYTGVKDNDPVVAFRGTGGTKDAWCDNFEGAFSEDTDIQRTAGEFIKKECGIYDDIVVTGHSKGGNLAQYVTVRCTDKISECVSFDAQGFSDEFIEENPDDVGLASPRITSISAYNDFVNILLTSIAGTCIYVANDGSAASAHSSVTLLTENEFDENGDFVSIRPQGALAGGLSVVTKGAVMGLTHASKSEQEAFCTVIGSAISASLTTPPDKITEGVLAPALGQIMAQLTKDIMNIHDADEVETALFSRGVYIDTAVCIGQARSLRQACAGIESAVSAVNRLREELAYTISSRICADRSLGIICDDLSAIGKKIAACSEVVRYSAERYEKNERQIALLMDA